MALRIPDRTGKHKIHFTDIQIDSHEITWLTSGWEFYPDQILTPGEESDDYLSVYIGQYFSLSRFHENGSPYGEGTYRITVRGTGVYSLLIPEVFSASRVYVNGELAASSGSLAPYRAQVKDLVVPVYLDGYTEILIQTANYTHYYSGVTYPPAIGSPEAVSTLIASRMIFYGFFCFSSLAVALFSSVVWIGMKKDRSSPEDLWLGILALAFSLRVCYPFVRLFGIPVTEPLYALEDVSASLGLLCVTRITSLLCLKAGSLTDRILTGTSFGFVLISGAAPLFLLHLLPGFTPVYGQIVYWYKALLSLLLTGLLLKHCLTKAARSDLLLLPGLSAYSMSLGAHAICLGRFEPAHFGWFEEWGSYILILFFSARMVLKNIALVRENRYLNIHLQEEVNHKTSALSTLLDERRILLASFSHDLKTPITSITTFTRLVEMNNTALDEESRQYLDTIRRKVQEMREQIDSLSEFTRQDTPAAAFNPVDLTDLVSEFFQANKDDMEVAGISFELSLAPGPHIFVLGDKNRLISVLQNLVYNAAAFTPEDGTVRITLSRKQNSGKSNAVLTVSDTGSGISPDDLPHIFDRFFTRRKGHTGQGMGLYIVKSVVTEHNGTICVDSDTGKGSVFTVTLPEKQLEIY